MIDIREIIAVIMIALGILFLVISAVGMLRLPDFYLPESVSSGRHCAEMAIKRDRRSDGQ